MLYKRLNWNRTLPCYALLAVHIQKVKDIVFINLMYISKTILHALDAPLFPIFSLTYFVLLQGCDTASPVSRAVPSVGVQPLHVSLQPQQTVRVEGPSPTPATPTTGELPFLFGSPDLRVIHVSFFSFCQRVSYAMGFVWYNLFSGNKLLSINQEH